MHLGVVLFPLNIPAIILSVEHLNSASWLTACSGLNGAPNIAALGPSNIDCSNVTIIELAIDIFIIALFATFLKNRLQVLSSSSAPPVNSASSQDGVNAFGLLIGIFFFPLSKYALFYYCWNTASLPSLVRLASYPRFNQHLNAVE